MQCLYQICLCSRLERLEEPYVLLHPSIELQNTSKYTTMNLRHMIQEFFQRHRCCVRIQYDSRGVPFVYLKLFLRVCTNRGINDGRYISVLDDVKKTSASFRKKRSRSVFMRIKHCFELCLEQTVRLFLVLMFIAIVEWN